MERYGQQYSQVSDRRTTCSRRAVLLVITAFVGSAIAAPLVVKEISAVTGDSRRSVLHLRLGAQPHGSWLTLEIRLKPRLQSASLVSPDGQKVDLTTRLRRLPAEMTSQPQLGDLYVMTDTVRDPKLGDWQLILEHLPAGSAHVVTLQAVHQPRFAADLAVIGDVLRSAVEADVLLRLMEYGLPARDAQPGVLSVTDADGRRATYRLVPAGVPGSFEARISVGKAGPLELAVESVWPLAPGRDAMLRTTRHYTVRAGPSPSLGSGDSAAGPLATQIERDAQGCVRAVVFTLPWQADAEGTYVLALAFGSAPRVTGSVDVARPGPAVLTAVLRGSRLAAMGAGLVRQADTVEVVRASGAGDMLLRRSSVPLSTPFEPAAVCR